MSDDDPGLIVFTGYQPDREASGFEYWAMRPDGTGLQMLDPGPVDDLSFSPGGAFIVTMTTQETAGDSVDLIVVSRPDGSEERRVQLPDPSGTAAWPSVSADGKRVAFVYANNASFTGARNLWSVSVGDDDFKRVSSTGDVESNTWAPDGTQLAFSDSYLKDIYVARADGSEMRHLARGGEPAWSPDGKRIAFTHDGQLSVVESSGGKPDVVSSDDGRLPAWSPDGTQLAFLSNTGPCGVVMCNRVFILDVDRGDTRPVGPELVEAGYLAWTTARVPTTAGTG